MVSEFTYSPLLDLQSSFQAALLGGGSPELKLTDCLGLVKVVEYPLPQLSHLQSGSPGWGCPSGSP